MSNEEFRQIIYDYYRAHKRVLPWRETTDPYRIMVSEIMLQQTQVPRVIEKYLSWMERFPTVDSLASATLGDVLIMWSGLGYNRRAKYLWLAAQRIMADFRGLIPASFEALTTLPGIGIYTAGAIRAFAFNLPSLVVETNIRAVYIHFFGNNAETVDDKDLIPLIEATMDRDNPREWFNALMDYGAKLKREYPNPTRKSTTYTKQSAFQGSNRQIRGAILKCIAESKDISTLPYDTEHVARVLTDLAKEGLIVQEGANYRLP